MYYTGAICEYFLSILPHVTPHPYHYLSHPSVTHSLTVLSGIKVLGVAYPSVASSKRTAAQTETTSSNTSSKKKRDEETTRKDPRVFPPNILSRTRHPGIMRKWALSCPPVGGGGAVSPLIPKSNTDRVRFVKRMEEEGARVFAHVNASVGYLEVTPLQVT